MLHLTSCRIIGNYKVNFSKMSGFYGGSELPKGAKNLGWHTELIRRTDLD